MKNHPFRWLTAALLPVLALSIPAPALAAAKTPSYPGCPKFNITISATGGNQDVRETRLKDGVIYTIVGGHGTTLTVGNAKSRKTVTFDTNGSVTHTASDTQTGMTDFWLSGQNLFILFPTDAGGPSTILYTGLVTFTATSDTLTLKEPITSVSGTQRDICAELG